jgi:acetyltransferase-like isoleucine patch superfamily enzyme
VNANKNRFLTTLRRFAVPSLFVTIYYLLRDGAKISPRAEVDFSSNLRFGNNCTVSSFTKIKASAGPLRIGSRCGFGTGCFLSSGENELIIGDNLVCGPNVVIMASSYRYDRLGEHLHDQGQTSKGTRIGNNCWIGAGAVLLDGTWLGDNCVVAANSVLSRRYAANSVLQGSPAKPMRGFHRASPDSE